MKIIVDYPPNYDLIRTALNPRHHVVFCYGDAIYNPSGRPLSPDIEHHEEIHSKQQGANPDAWYARYLQDPRFRLSQELEAYGAQYLFAKEHIQKAAEEAAKERKALTIGKNRLLRYALETMAFALSSQDYGNLISYGEAERRIKACAKTFRRP